MSEPDYIIESTKPNSAIILKRLTGLQVEVKMVLRLITEKDDVNYKNSIITFMKIDQKEYNRMIKNKKVLYKRNQQ